MMRGYRKMNSENKLDFILHLKYDISNSKIFQSKEQPSKLIFGAGLKSAELVVRQYLVSRILDVNFNKEILYCFGDSNRKFSYPLPYAWLQKVRKSGIKVNFLTSSLKFKWYVLKCFLGSILVFGKQLKHNFSEIFNPSFSKLSNYVYFDGLVPSNIPKSNSKPSFDIINWYLQWSENEKKLSYIVHQVKSVPELAKNGVNIKSVKTPIPPLRNPLSITKFILWFFQAMIKSLMDLLANHWWSSLLMMEAVKARPIQYFGESELAKDYLFHNSGWIYRPLWTYEAETKGSKITLYFYSRNCENFKYAHGYPIQSNYWQITNWQRYLVWNESHEEFIYRCINKNAIVLNVGAIWFQDNCDIEFTLPFNSVAVFPVQPLRDSYYQALGIDLEYYISLNANQFLEDCYQVILEKRMILVLKNKRDIGNLLTNSYNKRINSIILDKAVIVIDSNISANRVIQQSKAVISMPFTSTALIAQEMGKPTCYYDPFGMIQKDDRASSGIEIITGKKELEVWFSKLD
ncbi:polysaccharide biosynthesis PFTS motif protein [Aquirufa aurantiipilula]|uniref:Polysaccharide biosynthesis PFTS motif protein n=1 Tax=Aquirufa aurantiipilula TaxID=2696561 RepID=A0ABT6BL28_9BACT|nr:polysaccharide biosynthesis PFTS motif protein [Aquirufa aurantiipilula]MDF5690836.1 polysaccharide biosynthesis PFTS motif protein [Aquirufa aurantiipilula]